MEFLSPVTVKDANGEVRKVARVENTDGDPGDTIFVGTAEPQPILVDGDAWLDGGEGGGNAAITTVDGGDATSEYSDNQITTGVPALGSLLYYSGHSLAALGGSSSPDRGWANLLTSLLRAEDMSIARGGAVLGWAETTHIPNWFQRPYAEDAPTGSGGWANFLQNVYPQERGVAWKGLFNTATTYQAGDGIFMANSTWWVAKRTNVNKQPDLNADDWAQVTSPDNGKTSYDPAPGIHVSFFGNNDLWEVQQSTIEAGLTKFLERLRVIFARMNSAILWDHDHPMLRWNGGWVTGAPAYTFHSGNGYKAATSLAVDDGMEFNTPPDWPGGKIRIGFIQNDAGTAGGEFAFLVDGVEQSRLSGSVARGYVSGVTGAKLAGLVHTVTVPAGSHLVRLNTTVAFPNPARLSVDYVSLDTNRPTPHVFIGLFKPLTYSFWLGPHDGDTFVDAWNAGIANLITNEFPNIRFIIPDALSNAPDRAKYYSHDQVHPNDQGMSVLAHEVFEVIKEFETTPETISAVSEPGPGKHFYAKFGGLGNRTITADNAWQELTIASKKVRGAIVARPGDTLEAHFNGMWGNSPADAFAYFDLATIVNGVKKNYWSTNGPVQGTNGAGPLAEALRYEPVQPYPVHYVVRPEDIPATGGVVIVQFLVKVAVAASGRLIINSAGWQTDFWLDNKGKMDALRLDYAV